MGYVGAVLGNPTVTLGSFGPSWRHLGLSWRHLEPSWAILGYLGALWGDLGTARGVLSAFERLLWGRWTPQKLDFP